MNPSKFDWAFWVTVVVISWLVLGVFVPVVFGGNEPGEFGDQFGVATSLFSALAFVCVVLQLQVHSSQLRLQRAELKALIARESLEKRDAEMKLAVSSITDTRRAINLRVEEMESGVQAIAACISRGQEDDPMRIVDAAFAYRRVLRGVPSEIEHAVIVSAKASAVAKSDRLDSVLISVEGLLDRMCALRREAPTSKRFEILKASSFAQRWFIEMEAGYSELDDALAMLAAALNKFLAVGDAKIPEAEGKLAERIRAARASGRE